MAASKKPNTNERREMAPNGQSKFGFFEVAILYIFDIFQKNAYAIVASPCKPRRHPLGQSNISLHPDFYMNRPRGPPCSHCLFYLNSTRLTKHAWFLIVFAWLFLLKSPRIHPDSTLLIALHKQTYEFYKKPMIFIKMQVGIWGNKIRRRVVSGSIARCCGLHFEM